MIEAPDAETEIWIDYVWAKDEAEAYRNVKLRLKKPQSMVKR
ncbi:MAG TPA: hypothetical protein VK211_22975 [Kamptonema sp.]|nr:hypothetical protein [Kamptonema sp.]